MNCPRCQGSTRRFGFNRNGSQRYRCDSCHLTFTDEATRPRDGRRLSEDREVMALRHLLEGNSVRSTERLLEIHRDAFAGADAPSELFWQAAAKQFARAAEWLDKQPPAVFAEAAGLGLKMDVFIGSWIESDQFDLHLPAAFLRACGKHGLDISVCTND